MVELTTQLLIPSDIIWLPLCRIYKFGLNTLPSKTIAIPYTCGLSRPFSSIVAGEHSYICWVTWYYYHIITTNNLKDPKTKIFPSRTRGGKELPSATSWACVGFSLEEKRVMQQSSVSISLSFWEPRYQSSRRPHASPSYLHKQIRTLQPTR